MNNDRTRQMPKNNFKIDQEQTSNNLKDSANHLERLRLMTAEFKEFNRNAKEYVVNARKV